MESKATEVKLHLISADAFEIVLKYVNTGNFTVHYEDVLQFLHTALFLQIDSLCSICNQKF